MRTVVHLASEYWPYARSGGLAEAVRGIAHHQALSGRPTQVIMPLYRGILERHPDVKPWGEPWQVSLAGTARTVEVYVHEQPDEPTTFFIRYDPYFDRDGLYHDEDGSYPDNPARYALFCRAALDLLPTSSPGATLVHLHDWHTSLAAVYARTILQDRPYVNQLGFVVTAHNAGYQGHFGRAAFDDLGLPDWLFDYERLEYHGDINLLKGGLVFSDVATTVSPNHAAELRTDQGGFGLHGLFQKLGERFIGILNGIDYGVWDPSTDPQIEATFERGDLSGKAKNKEWLQTQAGLDVDPEVPLFAMTARLAEQKGFDIILPSETIGEVDAQWIFLGEGETRYRDALQELAEAHPDRVATFFEFTERREHRVLAGADYLLMPSLYEPCGLTQMRSQRYGALPIVRRVGGLADTVDDGVTGFVFDGYTPEAFAEAIGRALELYTDRDAWEACVDTAMSRDFSWQASVSEYRRVYDMAQAIRAEAVGQSDDRGDDAAAEAAR